MSENAIKLAFIASALNRYGDMVKKEMARRIVKAKAVDSADLLHSLSHRVSGAGDYSTEGTFHLLFNEYGRFLDMGVTKGHPLGGIKATQKILKNGRQKNLKPRKIYSPVVYGKLNWLMGELAYGFTEEAIEQIKNNLNGIQH